VGDLIYEATLHIKGTTEYGVTFDSLLTGTAGPPPEGARIDVAFEGTANGPKIKGKIRGFDYLRIRADGRFDLHFHETITVDSGENIDVQGSGIARLRPGTGMVDLREVLILSTSAKNYTWLNPLQLWATGTVDLAAQVIQVTA
jgi:hypothetical protein